MMTNDAIVLQWVCGSSIALLGLVLWLLPVLDGLSKGSWVRTCNALFPGVATKLFHNARWYLASELALFGMSALAGLGGLIIDTSSPLSRVCFWFAVSVWAIGIFRLVCFGVFLLRAQDREGDWDARDTSGT